MFNIQPILHEFPFALFQANANNYLPKIDFHCFYTQLKDSYAEFWSLHDHAIRELDAWDHRLDHLMPNLPIQTRIDELTEEIEATFAPTLSPFNEWLNNNGHGEWYHQLAVCLAKIPLRAARNIIQQLYFLIKAVVYGAVHPLKAINGAAKLIVREFFKYSQPETLSRFGVTMTGAVVAKTAFLGTFVPAVAIGICAAYIVGGLFFGVLREALNAEEDVRGQAVLRYLCQQGDELSQAFLTGLLIGCIIGSIQKPADQIEPVSQTNSWPNNPWANIDYSSDLQDIDRYCGNT